MKILNILLGLVVLILAAASLTASYFLFEKRVQLVNGWGKLVSAISQTASAMDENSGTRTAGDLTPEALGHRHYAELDAKLDKLKQQAVNLAKQRDALAASLREAGRLAEMSNLPEESHLQAIATYDASRGQVVAGVNDMRSRRDQLAESVRRSASKVNVEIAAADLRTGDADAAFRKFDNRVESIREQFAAYQDTLSAISVACGGEKLTFGDDNYAGLLPQVLQNVKKMDEKLSAAYSEAAQEQQKVRDAEVKNKKLLAEIEGLKERVAEDERRVVQYRRALGLDDQGLKVWEAGSPESRRAVRGRVVVVNEKFGYVGIDLGTNSSVSQPFGGKSLKINPQITPGMVMCVVRNTRDVNKVTYIGKVKLTAVDTETSIAEPQEMAPDQEIRVGDVVYLQEEDAAVKTADAN